MVIRSLFGSATLVGVLRAGLDDQSARHRELSGRMANLLTPPTYGAFAANLEQQLTAGVAGEADIHRQMVALADVAVRSDATATLLQRTYQQFRTALRNG